MTTPFEQPPADDLLRATWRDLSGAVPAPGAHLSEDDWVRLAADELDDAARERAADHIEACADCAGIFRAIGHLREGAVAIDPGSPAFGPSPEAALDRSAVAEGALPSVAPDGPSTSRAWWYGLAAAAAVALAMGTTLWRGSPGAQPAAPDAVSAPMAPVTAAAPPTPGPSPAGTDAAVSTSRTASAVPAPRAWAVLATAPAVTLPASFTIVMRGDSNPGRDAFLAAFGPAIAPYRAGRYAEAAEALQSLTARFPAVDEGWFYLGVARLYADRAADAVEPLRRARQSDVVAEQALWLEAVALERAGRADEATAVLREACDADRQSHAEVCATLPARPR